MSFTRVERDAHESNVLQKSITHFMYLYSEYFITEPN